MPRPLRVLPALLLLLPLTVAAAGAAGATGDDRADSTFGVVNNQHRQRLLHDSWPTDGVPGSILVTAATAAAAEDVAGAEGGDRIGERTVLLHVDPGTEADVAGRVAGQPGVIGVEPDRERQLAEVPNDPRYDEQWAHQLTHAETAWETTTGDASVTVAILDTGVDGRHPDLRDNLVEQVDLSSGTPNDHDGATGIDNDLCNVGHGTIVAGVIGAVGDNGTGVAGVAWDVSLVDIALTSHRSRCGILDSAIIAGLDYVVNRAAHVDVVNLSLGGVAEACPTALQDELQLVRDDGTLVVAAAGNDELRAPGATSIPASCDGVLSVAAVGDGGDVAVYSNRNRYVDIAAPGGDSSVGASILSTTAGGGYGEAEGTSFASPYIAGVAALLLSVEPGLSPDDLESILEHTARDEGTAGRDSDYGWGLVNAGAAVAAADDATIEEPETDPSFPVDVGTSTLERIEPVGTTTTPIAQAVAVSKQAFDDRSAVHAVIARSDGFADALAGSALGFGIGPLLFTTSTGALAGVTRTELERVLEPGSTVYLLGGTAALPSTLEGEIRALGFDPVRLAGTTRQQTSVAVAEELDRFLRDQEFERTGMAIVATAQNWPDAVTAGSLGAWFGMPILVTNVDSLDESVASYLRNGDWDRVYVIGGTAAISDETRRAIRDAAGLATGDTVRLAGVNRSSTAVAVATEFERLYSDQFESVFGEPAVPNVVAAVNLRRADGYAHALSATVLVGELAGVFVPVEGEGGTTISTEAQQYACRFPAAGFVMGGEDVIAESTATLFDELLRGDAPACH